MSVPTPLRVRLPFRSEDEFVASYGAHVGRDGFFLATKAPKAVGATLLFDLILADGTSILRGEGVVVRSNASGERPGMTLRFVRLEAAGKALVERIVSGRPARGSAPAEAQAHPSAWAPPSGPSALRPSPSREMFARPAHREAWAPPAGPTRTQPPTPFHPLPTAAPEPEEVSPDEVAEASPAEETLPRAEMTPRAPAEVSRAGDDVEASAEPAMRGAVETAAESPEASKSFDLREGEVGSGPTKLEAREAVAEPSAEPSPVAEERRAAAEPLPEPARVAGDRGAAGEAHHPASEASDTAVAETSGPGPEEPPLQDTSLEAWAASRHGYGAQPATSEHEGTEPATAGGEAEAPSGPEPTPVSAPGEVLERSPPSIAAEAPASSRQPASTEPLPSGAPR